jgi:cation diffusion facilitator family transporter
MSDAQEPAVMTARLERSGLVLSVVGALGMAALGLGFAALTGSSAVLLDGLFSLVGFAVGLVALRVATLVQQPDDEHFHFGYAAYEPVLNLAKGLIIAFITLFAALTAVDSIMRGGRVIRGELAAVYAVVAALGCLAIAAAQRRAAQRTGSPLLKVDVANWLVDGLMSGAVAVAFVVVVLVKDSAVGHLVPYADPAIVLLLSLLSAPIPIRIIRSNWSQLVGRAPDQEVQRIAQAKIDDALAGEVGLEPRLRLLETGRWLYVQVYVVVGPERRDITIDDLDRVRERICRSLSEERADIGIDVVFTTDESWFQRATGCHRE